MFKFVKIFFLPLLFALPLACDQHLQSKNVKSPVYSFAQSTPDSSVHNKYSWLGHYEHGQNITNRIPVPQGFTRVPVSEGSFSDWLRHLPLKKKGADVLLHNGSAKNNQQVHFAVIDIDAGGPVDLQQCADACMRLKAEYHYSKKEYKEIRFKFTSGDDAPWEMWKEGFRPEVKGNKVTWIRKTTKDESYKSFKGYLKTVFTYCGTYSLSQEMISVRTDEMKPGDVFLKGGFPGHAVIVVDMAENRSTGEKLFMIAQSYMPAQDIHILKNLNQPEMSPWYPVNFGEELDTPEWTFQKDQLRRFK